jgi:hypothetical protein
MLQFLKDWSQEVKTERKFNCSRAHLKYGKIYKTGNIQPIKKSGLKTGPIREDALRNSALEVQ